MPEGGATTKGNTTAHKGRKRPSQGRVVPAIPLALSKPKQIKSQSQSHSQSQIKSDAETAADASASPAPEVQHESRVATPPATTNGHVEAVTPTVNGGPQDAPAVDSETAPTTNGVNLNHNHNHNHNDSTVNTPVSRDSASLSVSEVATPNTSKTEEQSTPTDDANATTTTTKQQPTSISPSSARRMDMRPLRTQLPPAFVPSANQPTPQSATSPWQDQHLRNHAHHPSTSSIVFGGQESPTSSPVPPQSADSNIQSQQWPPLGANPPPATTYSAHAYHASEPFPQRPHNHPAHLNNWHMRQGHHGQMQPSFNHHGQAAFRYPPREVFTPSDEKMMNGDASRSRSLSRTSNGQLTNGTNLQSPFAADAPDRTRHHMPRDSRMPFQPTPLNPRHGFYPPVPSPLPSQEQAMRFDNAEALRQQVQSHYGNPMLADCHLQILDSEGGRQYLDAHKIIIARSPRLLELVRSSPAPASATLQTQVHISLSGKYVRVPAFMECVQYLYGGLLLMLEQLRIPIALPDGPLTNEDRIQHVLQYIGTATWLGLPTIAARATSLAINSLNWETLPAVLAFALEGGLGPTFIVDDGSEISCSSSSDSSHVRAEENSNTPTYDPYATELLHRIIDFAVHFFPPNFYLDTSAPELQLCPRLPPMPHTHSNAGSTPGASRADPRLSQIRFGDLKQEDHNRPSQGTTIISSILLSLPFALLKCVLEHNALTYQLGIDTVASIMRSVVAEREIRRKRILAAQSGSEGRFEGRFEGDGDSGMMAAQKRDLYFEEAVEGSKVHRAGFRLARRELEGQKLPPVTNGEEGRE